MSAIQSNETLANLTIRPNPKNAGSSYLKNDLNTLWARNAMRINKSKIPQDLVTPAQEVCRFLTLQCSVD